jgi:RNA polymerase sigma factor (sigma-70 family)
MDDSDFETDLARAIERIEIRLAIACGQTPRIEEAMHEVAARVINDEYGYMAVRHGLLWREVREKYLRDGSVLAPYILADDIRREIEESEARQLPQPPLPADRAALVWNHLPLVRSLASSVAGQNATLFDELESLGVTVLEEEARKFDPSRRVPFGAYSRLRLRGAMIDYAKSRHGRAIAVGGLNEAAVAALPKPARRATSEPTRTFVERDIRPPRHARRNNSRGILQRYLEAGGAIRHFSVSGRPLPTGDMRIIEQLLPKLNQRQRVVYRGRVLTDPPLTRAALARQLGIADETQISRIEKQAVRKIAKWLKVSP